MSRTNPHAGEIQAPARSARRASPPVLQSESRANTKNTFIIQNTSPRGSPWRRPPSARPASRLFRLRGGLVSIDALATTLHAPQLCLGFFRRRVRTTRPRQPSAAPAPAPSRHCPRVVGNRTRRSPARRSSSRAPPARDSTSSRHPLVTTATMHLLAKPRPSAWVRYNGDSARAVPGRRRERRRDELVPSRQGSARRCTRARREDYTRRSGASFDRRWAGSV